MWLIAARCFDHWRFPKSWLCRHGLSLSTVVWHNVCTRDTRLLYDMMMCVRVIQDYSCMIWWCVYAWYKTTLIWYDDVCTRDTRLLLYDMMTYVHVIQDYCMFRCVHTWYKTIVWYDVGTVRDTRLLLYVTMMWIQHVIQDYCCIAPCEWMVVCTFRVYYFAVVISSYLTNCNKVSA